MNLLRKIVLLVLGYIFAVQEILNNIYAKAKSLFRHHIDQGRVVRKPVTLTQC